MLAVTLGSPYCSDALCQRPRNIHIYRFLVVAPNFFGAALLQHIINKIVKIVKIVLKSVWKGKKASIGPKFFLHKGSLR